MSDYPEALSDAMALGELYRKRDGGAWALLIVKPVILADILKAWGSLRRGTLPDDYRDSLDGTVCLRPERLALRCRP